MLVSRSHRSAFRSLLLMLALLLAGSAQAHQPTNSYLTVTISPGEVLCQWEIAIGDLQHALSLDANNDGQVSSSEVQSSQHLVLAYALSHLKIKVDQKECALEPADDRIGFTRGNSYAVLYLVGTTPPQLADLEIAYRAFFDVDSGHRGLLRLEWNQTRAAVFTQDNPVQRFSRVENNQWGHFRGFVREGIWHIWMGADHILFLLALLVPSVVYRRSQVWEPLPSIRPALVGVAKVVTAFTVAHSITLSVAVLGWAHPPARWVEATIALSVLLAALNNLRPVVTRGTWMIAFGFGLIHGFGFANVLLDLGLSGGMLAATLVGFNLGVELGQLAIVLAFVPFAFLLRQSWFYRTIILRGGSALVAVVATIWMLERALELKVLPF